MSSSLKEYAHLRIPLEDVASATSSFADENILKKGEFGKVYKGQLLRSGQPINIVARRLRRSYRHGDREFWAELSVLSVLKHENLVSIVGFCDEGGEKIIINKYEENRSLDKHLSNPTLTWLQRLHICVGAARALSYIHYDPGRSYSLIHRNIKSSKILLDDSWKAKVCGFDLSIKNLANRRHRLALARPVGALGYEDPVCKDTGSVTSKSDVYSFGVVLFEVICGRKAEIIDDGGSKFLAPLAKKHYEDGKMDEIVDPNLRKQMEPQSFIIFTQTAYHCLNKQRSQRPDFAIVFKRLEKALELQWEHEHPEHSRTSVKAISANQLKGKNLEHLRIQLPDIVSATENFDEKYCIGSGSYGMVYKAFLNVVGSKTSAAIDGNNKDEMHKKHCGVAIKRIFNRQDGQGEQGFVAEFDMLTSCKHPNIVSLLGFCDEGLERILVYEFASKGSLDDYLGSSDKMTDLTWTQRIKMCLDIAHGLNYLHTTMEDKERIIHRDIKSANILLYENWEAKIADFGLSRFHPASTIQASNIAGTEVYLDPEYKETGKLKKESDTYSFGVVLFEILCGRLAYDANYYVDGDKGLPSVVTRRFNEKSIMEMVDPKIKEEIDGSTVTLNKGPNRDSLDAFLEIARQCLAEVQAERPTMEIVIKELEKALYYQENSKDDLNISFEDINLATSYFSLSKFIGCGSHGSIYQGEVSNANGHNFIAVKQLYGQADFLTQLEILFEYKHENIIGLIGYCNENDKQIIVYEHASRGSLDEYLKDDHLTWMKRLKICIDVATGLDFLHWPVVKEEVVIHRNITSANILLNGDWKAKISGFGISMICPTNKEMDYIIDKARGTHGYYDPLYTQSGILTKESDIYSLGVVLFEILCGRLAIENNGGKHRLLYAVVKKYINEGKIDKIVFRGIKEQIVPESLTTFSSIAYQCLHDERKKRPTTSDVLLQLKKALELQVDYEIWKPKLPADYKKLIQMSESPEIYSRKNNKDLYTEFSRGILLQKGKRWFSLGGNGERNEMISATKFSYKNRRSRKWQSVPKSRFSKVAKMLDILNVKVQIKIRTQFLSPGFSYGVHLIFKFCGPRKSQAKRMFVNLKYKKGKETLHAYFATWREDEWMMIELCRFYNHKKETDFEVLLESFARCYCGNHGIYVEGIEFRAITNVRDEEVGKLNEVQKKEHMISADKVLYDLSYVKLSMSKHSVRSRFEGAIELPRQQVFYIKCKIKSQMLSTNTETVCYLVFKLSKKCRGLHCPVIVRDLYHRRNKETGILYFRTPSPWNLHDTDWVPKKRTDGWMEVIVWKFNSTYQLKNDELPVILKFISYEGTMSGLIVRGFKFQPM